MSVPPTENVISIGNNSANAIQDMDILSSDIQALFDNGLELEDITLSRISHYHDKSSLVPTNTIIHSHIRNAYEYNFSDERNVWNFGSLHVYVIMQIGIQ